MGSGSAFEGLGCVALALSIQMAGAEQSRLANLNFQIARFRFLQSFFSLFFLMFFQRYIPHCLGGNKEDS